MHTSCPEYSVDLSAYFDGELEGEALSRLETHLQDCEDCQAGLEKLRRIREAMSQLSGAPGGRRSVLDAIRDKLGDEAPARDKRDLPS